MKSPTSLLALLGDSPGSIRPEGADRTSQPAVVDRGALLGGLTFIEGVACGWGRAQLVEWFGEHLVSPGRMMKPKFVHEQSLPKISLDPPARPSTDDGLPKLLATARTNVVEKLRGFIGLPPDDRFLKAAIFGDRVQRRRIDQRSVWVARPSEEDELSSIVLSLFAADVLMHREFHETKLCVCDVCGRVSYQPGATARTGCPDHKPRGQSTSGFIPSQPDPKPSR